MSLITTMARKARCGLAKAFRLSGRNKTLRELLSECGLDEHGRKAVSTPSPPVLDIIRLAELETTPAASEQPTKFIARFNYRGTQGQLTVAVVEVKPWAFSGRSRLDNSWQSYTWENVRGLICVAETGETLTPIEVLDRYY